MLKLLQINATANWGSTGKIAEAISVSAINQGWESYIAYGRYFNPSKSRLISIGTSLDTYWHYGRQRIIDNEGLCSKRATRKLIDKIKEIAPDVIQLHNIHDHYLNYQLLFEYLNCTDIKIVWTFHDCWAFTGHCFHFVMKNCEKWKTKCHECPLRDEYPRTLLDRSTRNYELKKELFTINKNLTIVSCSDWMAGFVKESFLKDKRTLTIYNGVDLNIFRPLEVSKRDTDHYKVLTVSSVWSQEKGLFDIFRLRKLLSANIEIVMVGVSAKQLKLLPKGVIGVQRTQNVQELVQLYNEADVFINPTYADTFPTVNIEALACGTPVITYNTGGSPEAVDGKTGIVISQGDVDALAKAIQQLKESPLNSNDCRQRAIALYNKDERYKDYIKLYESLLQS